MGCRKCVFYTSVLMATLMSACPCVGQITITVDGSAPRTAISPTLYGIFTEEINHAFEGGMYAEMVQNRDFEANDLPEGARWAGNLIRTKADWQERKGTGNELWAWSLDERGGALGRKTLTVEHPLSEQNPHSIRIDVEKLGSGNGAGLALINSGFWGMRFEAGKRYNLSFFARTAPGKSVDANAVLQSANGHERYSHSETMHLSGDWKQYTAVLTPTLSDTTGVLALQFASTGSVWLDVVSLFPEETYKHRVNGVRSDLMQVLANLHPAFVRFPGGAVSGGLNLDDRFQWRTSVGPISQRKGMFDLWGYYSTSGFGFHEYLQLIEDLGAQALYVCNPGFSDTYRHAEYAKPDDVPAFVQEAMDALEYALGPVDSKYGAQRAANGHPAPFPLRYVEIGNETSDAVYQHNYALFYTAIKGKYPQLTIISPQELGATMPLDVKVEMLDHHEFGTPEKLYADSNFFDSKDRSGPRYFVGEYAVETGVGQGNLRGALAEAAWMLGLERNSDLVRMASYAPLLTNVNDNAWPVNLISFDKTRVAPRSSYWVQKMFADNRPDEALRTSVSPELPPTNAEVYALGGFDKQKKQVVLKLVNRAAEFSTVKVNLVQLGAMRTIAEITILSNDDAAAENSIDDLHLIEPRRSTAPIDGSSFSYTLRPNSLTVLRIPVE